MCRWKGANVESQWVFIARNVNTSSEKTTIYEIIAQSSAFVGLDRVMSNNHLSGSIPKEIGELKLLEVLDLSHNNLSGIVPSEIGGMPSLKCLLLCGNNFHGDVLPANGMLDCFLEFECSNHIKSIATGTNYCIQRIGQRYWRRVLNQLKNFFSLGCILETKHKKCYFCADRNICNCNVSSATIDYVRRRLFVESSNLAAVPPKAANFSQKGSPSVLSSGAYPVHLKKPSVPIETATSPPAASNDHPIANDFLGKFIIVVVASIAAVTLLCFALIALRRYSGAKVARAQDAALLHRLSKVFVTGAPRLTSAELQTACEDFSNIIETSTGCLVFKGILSSGVEIAVLSSSIRSLQQWSRSAEREFYRKMDTFSRINHKNFVNLLGHCEEDDPFVRMMVFEYASNGNLYEHLHVKDMDHLDWTTRMRIVMGTCYCLEHMHHELNPPITIPYLQSDSILLTDDYAAKVADVTFWSDIEAKAKFSDDDESEPLHSKPGPTLEDNVYSLGILLLEIISSKSLSVQAKEYLNDKEKHINLIDPSLKSFKTSELEIVCDVIRECINEDPRQRPTIKDVTAKLMTVIKVSQDAATSRHSPLWWAELELLESG